MKKTYMCINDDCGKVFECERSEVLDILPICRECKIEEHKRLAKDANEQMKRFAKSVDTNRLMEANRPGKK